MKKSFFTLSCLLFLAFTASAQKDSLITINAYNASMVKPPVGVDTIGIIDLNASTIPSFAPATNHLWALTTSSYSSTDKITRFHGQNLFQFADSINYVFDSVHFLAKGMSYYVQQGRIRAKEIVDSTIQLVPTGTSRVDTIFYNYQEVFYSNPYVVQPYPETYPQSPWNTDYEFNTNFSIADPLLHLNHATARHYQHYTEDASVIGWGKMVVNSLDTDGTTHNVIPSDSLWVIQTQKMSVRLDSIILPFVDTATLHYAVSLYDTFHVKPVYIDTTYERGFYRFGSVTPLARVIYTDDSYTTIKRIEVHVNNLSKTFQDTIGTGMVDTGTAVINVSNAQKVLIYPNPVVNGSFFVEVPDGSSNTWSYEIMNMSGQVISSGNLPVNSGKSSTRISLPSLSSGTYYIGINRDNKPFGIKALQVLNR